VGHSIVSPTCSTQRTVPRYTCVAVTEIVESTSQTCIEGKIREISRKGCYVDSLNPFPVGTLLNLLISRNQGSFATKGKVIYVHEGFGMGVVFLDPIHDQLEILDYWLAEHPRSTDAL
jgi:hypothetical protein